MKIIPFLTIITFALFSASCSTWSPRKNYERGFKEGRASEVRRGYWESKQQQITPPPVQKHYQQIAVPAHTTADGIKIEAHTRTVEATEPTTP